MRRAGVITFAVLLLGLAVLAVNSLNGDPPEPEPGSELSPAAPIESESNTRYAPLNIACFAYRDSNRNGRYDMHDRPYAGLEVRLVQPSGKDLTRNSNSGGFANFQMSLGSKLYAIAEAGDYSVTVSEPQGMLITSDNARQLMRFERMPDAPAGLAPILSCKPIGIAPVLAISGIRPEQVWVTASRAGKSLPTEKSGTPQFQIAVDSGHWSIEYTHVSNRVTQRSIDVGAFAVVVSQPNLDRDRHTPLPRTIVARFDDLTSSDTLLEVPNGYLGLDWMNWVATHPKLYHNSGMINTVVSGEYLAYNTSGLPATVSATRPFDFVGTHLSRISEKAERHHVIIRAWRGKQMIYEDRILALEDTAQYFDANYRSIDRLEFSSDAYWHVAVDDMRFRTK